MALTQSMGSRFEAKFGSIQTYIAGGAIFYGATVVIRLNDTNEYVYAAVDDPTDAYKQLVVGWATESAVLGDRIRIRREGKIKRSIPYMPSVVVGRLACIKDDENVQLYGSSTCRVVVGRITEKTADAVFVDFLDRPVRLATSLLE